MTPVPKPWFRFYRETITDRKLARLTGEQRHLWTVLMALALDRDGFVQLTDGVPYTPEDLADLAGIQSRESVVEALDWFKRVGMIAEYENGVFELLNWGERQFQSDHSAERTGAYRKRLKEAEPSHDRHNPVTVTDQSRAEQSRDSLSSGDDKAARSSPEIEALAALWNLFASENGLPLIRGFSTNTRNGKRRVRVTKTALKEHPDISEWKIVIRRICSRPHCRGENDTGWRASFDYLIAADTFENHFNGKFSACDQPHQPQVPDLAEQWKREDEERAMAEGVQ